MAYKHGVYVLEETTEEMSLVRQSAGIPFVVGIAPIRKTPTPAPANTPILCRSYNEAVAQFGYSTDIETYGLCEAMDVLFGLYNVQPVCFVNVFDPRVHKKVTERELHLATAAGTIELDKDIVEGSIKLEQKVGDGDDETWTVIDARSIESDTDATVITLTDRYAMGAQIYVTYAEPDVSRVSGDDIAGAADAVTGRATGLELVAEVYPRFSEVVGTIIAPGFSHLPSVGAKLAAKAKLINGHFSALGIADLNTRAIGGYATAAEWKTTNGYNDPFLIACYPQVGLGNKKYHLSTHVAGIMARSAADNDDIPMRSPSNLVIHMDSAINADGTDCFFGYDAACELNGAGIVTVTNWGGAWKLWGNRTSIYPASLDPKDAWISVRAMFNYVKAYLSINYLSNVDEPVHRRQIDSIVNRANTYLNGLAGRGALLGASVEFNEEDNPAAALLLGQMKFRVKITPPPPTEVITFVMSYDVSQLENVYNG